MDSYHLLGLRPIRFSPEVSRKVILDVDKYAPNGRETQDF
jgi:hypothetical protein